MSTVIDLHAHPSLKTWLGGKRLGRRQRAKTGFAPLTLRSSYPSLRAGGVGVVWSSIYVPERRLASDCWLLWAASLLVPRLRRALGAEDPSRIAHRVIDHVEAEVDRVNEDEGATVITVPRDNGELDAAEAAGQLAFLHTFEGAHVLNGDLANVRAFHRRGVCSITLAHFYPNEAAPPVDAIPDDLLLRRLGCFRYREDLDAGLTSFGAELVAEMREVGMIVDLTHATPRARRQVYALPDPRHRPLVLSHTGMATLRDHPLNASPEDVRAVADTGGVIGVILYNHWLAGHGAEDRLHHVVRHVRELARLGGDDCVAFGSDFDGMTDPPDDLREPAHWPRLTRALETAGFDAARIEKFAYGNARRVLRDGWV